MGIGETIIIEFDKAKSVSEIDIYPGFLKTKNRYLLNGQPTKVLVEWDDGQKELILDRIAVDESDDIFDNDEVPISKLHLENDIQTQYLKLTILDAVAGSKYKDVAVSEVKVYGKTE